MTVQSVSSTWVLIVSCAPLDIGVGYPARMPWSALSHDENVRLMLAQDSLPETVALLVDPSHLKTAGCDRLLDHWQERQNSGLIPFRFRMILDPVRRDDQKKDVEREMSVAKKPTASEKKKALATIKKGKRKADSDDDTADAPPQPTRSTGKGKAKAAASGTSTAKSMPNARSGASGSGSKRADAPTDDVEMDADPSEPDDAVVPPLRPRPAPQPKKSGLAQEDETFGQPTPFGTFGQLSSTYLDMRSRLTVIGMMNNPLRDNPDWDGLIGYIHNYGEVRKAVSDLTENDSFMLFSSAS